LTLAKYLRFGKVASPIDAKRDLVLFSRCSSQTSCGTLSLRLATLPNLTLAKIWANLANCLKTQMRALEIR
jgi:hypothetical protein